MLAVWDQQSLAISGLKSAELDNWCSIQFCAIPVSGHVLSALAMLSQHHKPEILGSHASSCVDTERSKSSDKEKAIAACQQPCFQILIALLSDTLILHELYIYYTLYMLGWLNQHVPAKPKSPRPGVKKDVCGTVICFQIQLFIFGIVLSNKCFFINK